MTGTPSRTARVPTARWDLKEAAGKAPNQGTRTVYEADRRGRGSAGLRTQCHPKRRDVYAAGLGRRSRALPWEVCTRAMEGRPSPFEMWAESRRSQQRAARPMQRPEARTSNPGPMPESR